MFFVCYTMIKEEGVKMLIIKNCNLWTMAELNDINADILVEDGKIKEIGSICIEQYPNAEVIDACGKFVMPGIVDPHCHIGVDH